MTRTNHEGESALIACIVGALIEDKRKNKESPGIEIRGNFPHIFPGRTLVNLRQGGAYALLVLSHAYHSDVPGKRGFYQLDRLDESTISFSDTSGERIYSNIEHLPILDKKSS